MNSMNPKTLTQRFREISETPQRLERVAEGVGTLVAIAGLIALFALAMSIVALERSSHAH